MPRPDPMPTRAPTAPTADPSTRAVRRTCVPVAPISRSTAMSLMRPAAMVENVLETTITATTTAMPRNTAPTTASITLVVPTSAPCARAASVNASIAVISSTANAVTTATTATLAAYRPADLRSSRSAQAVIAAPAH